MHPQAAAAHGERTGIPYNGRMTAIIDIASPQDTAVLAGSVCTMGVFDGMHRGHAFLIDRTLADARERGARSVIITFRIDPDEVFTPHLLKLSGNEERLRELAECGADAIAVLPFDREFAATPPLEFLGATFGANTPAAIHVGTNFRFGSKGSGTADDLAAWGAEHGMDVSVHDLLEWDGDVVSSTRIRALVSKGDLKEARELLGHTMD